MSENFTNSDLLIQYLDGELEGEQLVATSNKILADENLAAELVRLRMAKAAMNTYGLKKNIGSIHKEMMKELAHQATAPVARMRSLVTYSLRIAAAVLLIIGSTAVFQYFTATPERLVNNNFEVYRLNDTRGNGNNNQLETAYRNGRMQEVMDAFKQMAAPKPQDYFLYGNAALSMHNATAAIASFQSLQQLNSINNTSYYEDDTAYFLALAYLENKQPATALPIFEKIYSDKSHPYHNKISGWFMLKLRRMAS